jgi:hypothetical protein
MSMQDFYPEHVFIPLDRERQIISDGDCQSLVTKYLQESLGLKVESVYPSLVQLMPLVNKLVDGFAIAIAGVRLIFIPTAEVDLNSFEIEREWVDLSNWYGDYYVPIQVDLEGKYLHLWGFITHRELQQYAEFDRVFQTYSIHSQYLHNDLDRLWLTCELQAEARIIPPHGSMLTLPQLIPLAAARLIDRLQQDRSVFSPRLEFPFEKWGEILNNPQWLELYSQREPTLESTRAITKLSNWLSTEIATIAEEWKTISEFFQSPQFATGMRSTDPIDERIKELTICPQVKLMHRQIPTDLASLVEIINHTSSKDERWEAIEYLWKINPEHPALPIYKLLDLGLFFQGENLSLLVSIVPTQRQKFGILIRLSTSDRNCHLPVGITLGRWDEDDRLSREVKAKDSGIQCLQLIFDADFGDRFSICVTLNNRQFVKHFEV